MVTLTEAMMEGDKTGDGNSAVSMWVPACSRLMSTTVAVGASAEFRTDRDGVTGVGSFTDEAYVGWNVDGVSDGSWSWHGSPHGIVIQLLGVLCHATKAWGAS